MQCCNTLLPASHDMRSKYTNRPPSTLCHAVKSCVHQVVSASDILLTAVLSSVIMPQCPHDNAQHYLLEVSIQQAGLSTVQVTAAQPLAAAQHTVMYHLQPEQHMSL
jgi:hypothetical protein